MNYTEEEKRILGVFNKYLENIEDENRKDLVIGQYVKDKICLFKKENGWEVTYIRDDGYNMYTENGSIFNELLPALSDFLHQAVYHCLNNKKLSELETIISMAIDKKHDLVKRKEYETTTSYIDWVESFTNNVDGFNTNYVTDKEFNFNDYDKQMIKDASMFYDIVSSWAAKNYINGKKGSIYREYNLKYKDNLYVVGIEYGQGSRNWIGRIKEAETDIINFEEVMNNTVRDRTIEINDLFDQLKKYAIFLQESGFDQDKISARIKKISEDFDLDKEPSVSFAFDIISYNLLKLGICFNHINNIMLRAVRDSILRKNCGNDIEAYKSLRMYF